MLHLSLPAGPSRLICVFALALAACGGGSGEPAHEAWRINKPLDGFSERVAKTVTASGGNSSAGTSFFGLGLRGTGITAVGFPNNNTLVLSVNK